MRKVFNTMCAKSKGTHSGLRTEKASLLFILSEYYLVMVGVCLKYIINVVLLILDLSFMTKTAQIKSSWLPSNEAIR